MEPICWSPWDEEYQNWQIRAKFHNIWILQTSAIMGTSEIPTFTSWSFFFILDNLWSKSKLTFIINFSFTLKCKKTNSSTLVELAIYVRCKFTKCFCTSMIVTFCCLPVSYKYVRMKYFTLELCQCEWNS